jgi:transcription antitermination factor NusG
VQNETWYCAKTIGRETRAKLYLERAGLSAFRPEIHRYFTDRHTQQERRRVLSLFPGYVFVRIETDAERDRAVSAIGVAYLLGNWTGDRFLPRQMPSLWLAALMSAGPIIQGRRVAFKPGDLVRRAVGQLAELIGEVEAVDKEQVADVKVTMLGKAHRLRIPSHELEPVADNGHGHCEVSDSVGLAQSAKLCQNLETKARASA